MRQKRGIGNIKVAIDIKVWQLPQKLGCTKIYSSQLIESSKPQPYWAGLMKRTMSLKHFLLGLSTMAVQSSKRQKNIKCKYLQGLNFRSPCPDDMLRNLTKSVMDVEKE